MTRPPPTPATALAVLGLTLLACGPAAARQAPRGLPPAMHGIWGRDADACARQDSEGRAEVSARAVEFFASACTFTRFRRSRDGTWTAHGRCAEEGDARSFPGQMRLRIAGEGRLRIDTSAGGEPHIFQRCGGNPPLR